MIEKGAMQALTWGLEPQIVLRYRVFYLSSTVQLAQMQSKLFAWSTNKEKILGNWSTVGSRNLSL
jgi:hypothetical protein